jgi:hypothetical protein
VADDFVVLGHCSPSTKFAAWSVIPRLVHKPLSGSDAA